MLAVLAADSEEAGLIALRTAFEINKAFRSHLEEHVPAFLEVVRKARSFWEVYVLWQCARLKQ